MSFPVLTACLISFLVGEYANYSSWALCPGSLNCLCKTNISTRSQFTPKCIDLVDLEEFCPTNAVSNFFKP